jgi:hypothetical protein
MGTAASARLSLAQRPRRGRWPFWSGGGIVSRPGPRQTPAFSWVLNALVVAMAVLVHGLPRRPGRPRPIGRGQLANRAWAKPQCPGTLPDTKQQAAPAAADLAMPPIRDIVTILTTARVLSSPGASQEEPNAHYETD